MAVSPRSFDAVIQQDPSLSPTLKALLITDGTVTHLLEVFAGERMRVDKLDQTVVKGGPGWLAVDAGEDVVHRRILLRGDRRAYLFAESWLVPSRMPTGMREALATDRPLGNLWKAARLETFREIVDFRREARPDIASLLGVRADILSRSYLVNTGGRPMSLVSESLPADLFT